MVTPKYHIFICTSCRPNGVQKGLCHQKDSVKVIESFMQEIEDRDLTGDCMVTNTGCFGICSRGPIAVVYPEGGW
jgi:predicted metal-binding protein